VPRLPRVARLAAAATLAIAVVGQTPAAAALGRSMASAPAWAPASAPASGTVALEPKRAPLSIAGTATVAEPDLAIARPPTATTAVAEPAATRPSRAPQAPKPRARSKAAADSGHRRASPTYRGRNHVWFPALGISRAVAWFPCSRSTEPGLAVYRWGCAGSGNVYLFAHAYAAFEPLHDAYVSGRLRRGMTVVYADGAGHVHTYAIAWWRLTTPDRGGFAYAAQSRPSLTLQTCVGAHSQYRLIVRFVRIS
jgi:hypothetical protein